MFELIYWFMLIGIPILFCIVIYRLRKRLPQGKVVASVIIGIIAFRTVALLPIYLMATAISDSSYELFQTCLFIFIQYYIYSMIVMGLYIASCIFMKKKIKYIVSITILAIMLLASTFFVGKNIFKERERPDKRYLEMKQIDSNSFVGLSKEEVIRQLGEPGDIHDYSKIGREYYTYHAGNIYVGIIWGDYNIFTTRHPYRLTVVFDENDKVESISMREET